MEFRGPRSESTTIILLNGHSIKLLSTYISILIDWCSSLQRSVLVQWIWMSVNESIKRLTTGQSTENKCLLIYQWVIWSHICILMLRKHGREGRRTVGAGGCWALVLSSVFWACQDRHNHELIVATVACLRPAQQQTSEHCSMPYRGHTNFYPKLKIYWQKMEGRLDFLWF